MSTNENIVGNGTANLLQEEAKMMKLERLIQAREGLPNKQFPIPVKELLARYEQLYTGAISDVLREHVLLDQSIGQLVPLRPERTVAGIAFTVKSAPNVTITGEMTVRTEMLEAMPADSFVVWETSNDEKATLWGGVMTATAVGKGIRAALVDGGIRDTHQILQKDFPVYYRYRIPNGSLGRCLITHYQTPILIRGVLIKPGDVILGDIDGVVVVPHDIAYDVLVRAEEIRANEKKIFRWVAEGKTVREITEHGGYF